MQDKEFPPYPNPLLGVSEIVERQGCENKNTWCIIWARKAMHTVHLTINMLAQSRSNGHGFESQHVQFHERPNAKPNARDSPMLASTFTIKCATQTTIS